MLTIYILFPQLQIIVFSPFNTMENLRIRKTNLNKSAAFSSVQPYTRIAPIIKFTKPSQSRSGERFFPLPNSDIVHLNAPGSSTGTPDKLLAQF